MTSSSSQSSRRRNRDTRSASPPCPKANPVMDFQSCPEATRLFFLSNDPVPNPWSLRHVSEASFSKYQELFIRGYLVQGNLVLDDPAVAEARRLVENVGADDGVYIRGCRFDFDPVVINQLFMTPFVEHSHVWEGDDLSEAIIFLTDGRCHRWETFSLTYLVPQYHSLYKLCSLNWLPGFHEDSMIKNRLRFLCALVRKKPIDFGRLVYDQVLEMACSSDADKKIILPNFIYQTLILQRKITALPGGEPLIGHPLWISGDEVDSHISRGRSDRSHVG
ncbi:hypothetical protein F2Q69_00027577 [Brassica cretica]|uniref:Putative plant transposon protein domain-containing protein n=1 Tax=Brassica cretica TaxID=69181 RepID=A0A8S9S6Y6_BRACR|nr:hypothetical protein F2Q69_00027577 [Brassica cretica]